MTVTATGVVVGRERQGFLREVLAEHGEETADAVMVALLPPDERLHVEQHRRQLDRRSED